jgi:SMODS and SLOG-associating 2TM effector domain 1/Protein of unknown function (DUF4231)
MTSGNISHTLSDVWTDRKIWSLTASQLKQSLVFWRGVVLLLTILGAFLETSAAQLHNLQANLSTYIGGLGAVALILIPIIRTAKLGNNQTKEWLRSRSVSEGLKTEVYLYLTGTQPYEDQSKRDAELSKQRNEIVGLAGDLYRYTANARNQLEKKNLTPPQPIDVNVYIAERVNQQIEKFYRPKASKLSRQANRLRKAEFLSSIVAAALGVVPKFFDNSEQFSAWIAVVTTIGVAITAHLAAGRFDYLVDSYLATADRLESLRNQWLDAQQRGLRQDTSKFIHECEAAISVENEGWMAKFLQAEN